VTRQWQPYWLNGYFPGEHG